MPRSAPSGCHRLRDGAHQRPGGLHHHRHQSCPVSGVNANPDKLQLLDFPASEESKTYAIATQKNEEGAALAEEFNAAMETLKEEWYPLDALVAKVHLQGGGRHPA